MSRRVRHILVMGVTGVGKTTIARLLSASLGGVFLEADDKHPVANIAAMSSGVPLTDEMRWPWLDAVCDEAGRIEGSPVVIACSALKLSYRNLLRRRLGQLKIVHLAGSPDLIRERMHHREGHYMPVSLLDSQLADLETPLAPAEDVITLDVDSEPTVILDKALSHCRPTPDGDKSGS